MYFKINRINILDYTQVINSMTLDIKINHFSLKLLKYSLT